MSGVFRPDASVASSDIVFDIFPHPGEVEVARHLLKHLLNPLMPTRAFYFMVDFKDFVSGIN